MAEWLSTARVVGLTAEKAAKSTRVVLGGRRTPDECSQERESGIESQGFGRSNSVPCFGPLKVKMDLVLLRRIFVFPWGIYVCFSFVTRS